MDNTPDISKIIGLIMENPEIIEKMKGLLGNEAADTAADETESISSQTLSEEASAPAIDREAAKRRRHALLSSIKPYVSESRAKAIDTMINIVSVIDTLGGK